MKIAYISPVSFSDVDISLISEMQHYADISYFLYLYPNGLKGAAVNINNVYSGNGVFLHHVYPELKKMSKFLNKSVFYVFNTTKNSTFSWQRIKASFLLYKKIKEERYDIIHYTWFPGINMYWLYLFRNKLVLTIHDPIPHSSLKSKFQLFDRKVAMHFCKHFILLNKKQKKDFITKYKININKQVIFDSKLSCYNYLQLYNKDSFINEKYILFFGKIYSYKGLQFLLPAMRLVHKQYPNVKLIVAGSGVFCFDIKQYESLDYIEIRNRFIPDDELATLIRNCLFVVAPYIDATQSGVVMSAFAFNKPCLVTNVGALPEMVIDNMFGRVIESSNEMALVNAICEMLSDEELLSSYSKNIESMYKEGKMSWNYISKGLIRFYMNIN